MMNRYRETVVEINLNNLYQNYKNISNIVKTKKVIPVVKANAYGHGAVEVVRYLAEKGVDYFAVSLLEEALELRLIFPDINILCMGIVEKDGLLIASENNITITISNFDQIKKLTKMTEKVHKGDIRQNLNIEKENDNLVRHEEILKVHLKIDTGMNRLGFKTDSDIQNAFLRLQNLDHIFLEGIFSHFSTADCDKKYYDHQLSRFTDIYRLLNYKFEIVHLSNSSSQIKYENQLDFTTHTRLGISLYGLTLDEETNFLLNTMKLKTKISQYRKLSIGDKVGYGATYTAKCNELIGILPIGYADGFVRKNEGGDVEIKGKRYPIIGRICMDQCFIRIDESVTKDDDVILYGGLISIDEVSNRLGTINYEVVCQISNRVPREYIK